MSDLTLDAFRMKIGSEERCAELLHQARWPDGFRCPCCGHSQAAVISTRRLPLYECRRCRRQTSLTAGTVLEKSRTPLLKWLFAMWLLSQTDQGVNAVQLRKLIQVTYKTAFDMLRKLRFVLGSAECRPPLEGSVQAGLDFLGRLIGTSGALEEARQQPIVTAVSNDADGLAKQVVLAAVSPGCVRRGLLLPIGQQRFADRFVAPKESPVDWAPSLHYMNRRFPKLRLYGKSVRGWIQETFHGLGKTYLQSYLDEFAFRVNIRLQRVSPFDRLMRLSMNSAPYSRPVPNRISRSFVAA